MITNNQSKRPTAFLRPVLWSLCLPLSAGAAPAVDYLRDVKPILAEHCYRCHGGSQQKGELRLDTAVFARRGGKIGAGFEPGQSAKSLIVQAIKGTHPDLPRMPFKKPSLPEAQITVIEQWIEAGGAAPTLETPEKTTHWAFVPPERGAPPPVKQANWIRNPIDNFILARLEKEGVTPSAEADRITLIRRLSLDLTGLPPTVAEVDAFARDPHPDAYERLVERLLASPHYGERWGRHWLDVARYADSNGYSIDAPRSIWKYRDWVIKALNRDLPFDQFTIDQLAGDLLPHSTIEQQIATGFNRNTQINQEGGIDPEQFRVESVMDRVATTTTAFLGITLACAQCHDHKFDPFTQREYYQFYAFFNSTVEDGHGKGAPEGLLEIPGENEALDNAPKELEEAEADLDRYLDTKGSDVLQWEQALNAEGRAKLPPEIHGILDVASARRTPQQKRAVYAVFRTDDPEFKQRHTKLMKLEKRQPKPVTTLVMVERRQPRKSFLFIKGDFTRPGDAVTPNVPAALPPLQAQPVSPLLESNEDAARAGDSATADSSDSPASPALPNRLDLARWIVDPQNPLTARVTVNRIWQQYFGRGLVETENDFGTQGAPPSHPELLDWLAIEFMNLSPGRTTNGIPLAHSSFVIRPSPPWSLKHLHRLIVTSATYRQSSHARPDLRIVDPNNRWLARQSRLRLDAEIVRDVCLKASGLLQEKIGGPSVFPPQPNGVMNLGQSKREWKPSVGRDRYRRGLYTFFWRATPHPALMVFDEADGFSACTRRNRSNTPLQALTLLNDDAFYECAQALATRVLREGPKTEPARLDLAFRLCLARAPDAGETQRLLELFNKERAALDRAPQEAAALLQGGPDRKTNVTELAAWTSVSRVLLNLDETITRE
jgi:hypothetical protein